MEKRISFSEAKQLVEVKLSPTLSNGPSFSKVVSSKISSKITRHVECQTNLT